MSLGFPGQPGFPGAPGLPGLSISSNVPGTSGDPGLPGLTGEQGMQQSSAFTYTINALSKTILHILKCFDPGVIKGFILPQCETPYVNFYLLLQVSVAPKVHLVLVALELIRGTEEIQVFQEYLADVGSQVTLEMKEYVDNRAVLDLKVLCETILFTCKLECTLHKYRRWLMVF